MSLVCNLLYLLKIHLIDHRTASFDLVVSASWLVMGSLKNGSVARIPALAWAAEGGDTAKTTGQIDFSRRSTRWTSLLGDKAVLDQCVVVLQSCGYTSSCLFGAVCELPEKQAFAQDLAAHHACHQNRLQTDVLQRVET